MAAQNVWFSKGSSTPKHLASKLRPFEYWTQPVVRGRFHRSWAHGANHRCSSIKVGRTAQIALYAYKSFSKFGCRAQNSLWNLPQIVAVFQLWLTLSMWKMRSSSQTFSKHLSRVSTNTFWQKHFFVQLVFFCVCVLFITFSYSTQTLYLFLHRYQWKKFPKLLWKGHFWEKNIAEDI